MQEFSWNLYSALAAYAENSGVSLREMVEMLNGRKKTALMVAASTANVIAVKHLLWANAGLWASPQMFACFGPSGSRSSMYACL